MSIAEFTVYHMLENWRVIDEMKKLFCVSKTRTRSNTVTIIKYLYYDSWNFGRDWEFLQVVELHLLEMRGRLSIEDQEVEKGYMTTFLLWDNSN